LAVVFVPGPAQSGAASSFAIVPEASYQESVVALALRGFTNRHDDPYFAPSDLATRAQLAVYLARALRLPDSRYGDFVDAQRADWGFGEIAAVHRAGIMDGTSPLTFSPNAPVSREQAAALLVSALRYSVERHSADVGDSLTPYQVGDWLAGFRDRDFISPQHVSSVAIAYRLGLFDIPAEGWLLPRVALTHQELVSMLQRTFVRPVAKRLSLPVPVDPISEYPDLKKGSEGPLVMLLESRLAAMNYPCGSVDGKYDYRTKDAVLAFEKYERMKRNGIVTGDVWERLLTASVPQPVFDKPGRRIEVDLTRQVLMMIVDNQVIMTIHVSTGKYGTPTGEWRIRTRIKGWRPTSLGPVWSPSYFMARNAIHGYPSVPTYPASHGCVRTPIWVQNSLIDQIELGIAVDVFYNKVD
jgi:peptidoglycan hydrolase-like protein with peptidoglycan-binding domain